MNPLLDLESNGQLTDPDHILDAWRVLLTKHHHLHGPEAAAMLGVPEAALVASRVGSGAVALSPDLAQCLSPLDRWGKVLVASRCAFGVVLAIVEGARVERCPDGRLLRLRSAQHDVMLDADTAASSYLFEDRDAHGHTFSVNWFDGRGDCVGRVFLIAKSGREHALTWLRAQALPEQSRMAVTSPVRATRTPHHELSGTTDPEPLAAGKAAATLLQRAILAANRLPELTLAMEGMGTAIVYRGPLGKTHETPPSTHAADEGCKLHARPGATATAWRWRSRHRAATEGLRFDAGDGGQLYLIPEGQGAVAIGWLEELLKEVQS